MSHPCPTTPRGRLLERASSADVAAIVAIETHPSMMPYLGSWTPERHARQLGDDDYRYFVVRDDRGIVDGFAIVVAYAASFHWFEIGRIAVMQPGDGRGSDLLQGVLAATFDEAHAHRIQLDCYEDNLRARRAYVRAGFCEEGIMRRAVTRDGVWTSLVLFALLADEYVRPPWGRHASGHASR